MTDSNKEFNACASIITDSQQGRHDNQHKGNYHNDIRHNDAQRYGQNFDTQRNTNLH
jgi:hypothetical protein